MDNQEVLNQIKNVKKKIESMIEKGYLSESTALLDQLEEAIPGDPDVYSMRAVIHIVEGRLDTAESVLNEGLKGDSVHFDLLFNLAYINELRGVYQKAADLYCKARTAAFSETQKQNLDQALERIKKADGSIVIKNRVKIVFFVREGLDSFLGDTINSLEDDYWVRKIIVHDLVQIDEGMQWADICWFEWCDELIAYGSNRPMAIDKKIICRLHRYEVFTCFPGKVKWENINKLIIVTAHLKELLEINFPGISDRVEMVVIENGVNLKKFEFKKRSNGFNLAMVGYLHSRKNPVLLLQIIKKLVNIDKRYKLFVAGQFQEQILKLYWDYQIKRMGLEDNVIFEGWQKDINSWLEDKNYLISASIHESFGYGIAESMARGIKPVIHDFLYANDIWDEEFLFNTVDEAVDQIVSGKYESQKYRSFIEDNYSLEKQFKKTNELLKGLSNEKSILERAFDIIGGTKPHEEMPEDDITVLIASHNRANILLEDINKGFKLGRTPKLIIDDSSDTELEYLEELKKSQHLYNTRLQCNDRNEGVAFTRRKGLDIIKTKYTVFLDDDDMLFCVDGSKIKKAMDGLSRDSVLIVPRFVINYSTAGLSFGYDRLNFSGRTAADVLEYVASTGEMAALLSAGSIGMTEELKKHSNVYQFVVSEDYVMLSRILAGNLSKQINVTDSLIHVRRISDRSLSKTLSPGKHAFGLLAQAVACYFCLKSNVATKDNVLKWMKDRSLLIEKIYGFGERFELELFAYLTGNISEPEFLRLLSGYGLKLYNSLDEIAPELLYFRHLLNN